MKTTIDLPSNRRWTVSTEYTGHLSGKPRHVVRFCGEWVGDRPTRAAALLLAVAEKARRDGALTIEEIPA